MSQIQKPKNIIPTDKLDKPMNNNNHKVSKNFVGERFRMDRR